ncbi:MAG: hypothetical protein Tp1123DCM257201_63 [Prokaryotic dsDNA virus sp.]|nr:MAG: hypothetical protein Tp1123DCM257201_63 [Prokaryotic dsDNA virus sp.]|tara:strand:+ start:20578 stop:20763 length:186 start_codon:yes stop_codon:yes gene_type:complete
MKNPYRQKHRLMKRIKQLLAENHNVRRPGISRSTFGLKIISDNPDVDAKKELAETEEEDNA